MTEAAIQTQAPARRIAKPLLRWLALAAALLWLLQAVTGTLLSYYFEINDTAISSVERSKDLDGIDRRMQAFEAAGGEARINWIWSTAGLKDRFMLNYT